MSAKVSIVVPIYNGEKYIDNCVRNLLSQTYENLEFILVDDGSTDNSGKMCDEYASKDSRIIVIHQENGGLSAARNSGTAKASGDYIVYYDVDDDITENLVADNVKLAVENDADVVFFSFWYYFVDTALKKENAYAMDFVGSGEEFFHECLNETVKYEVFNAPWNKLYKMDFLRKHSLTFLPEFPIYEDIIFASRMLQFAEKIVVNRNRYYVYYVRSSGSLITSYKDSYFKSVTKYYENAMEYCKAYSDNKEQVKALSTLYVRLVATNLKQISNKKDMDKQRKYELISGICESEQLKSALSNAELEFKKKVLRSFVYGKRIKAIYYMYNVLALTN